MRLHCVHMVIIFCVGSLPALILNSIYAKESFDYWENREFEMKEVFEPIETYCDDIMEAVYTNRPGAFDRSDFINIRSVDDLNTVENFLRLIDRPWWYDRDVGPENSNCGRLLVMYWDMFGFEDTGNVLSNSEGLDCGDETCGGRLVRSRFDIFQPLGGFPLIWDIESLSSKVTIENIGAYKTANALLYIFPIAMIASCVKWVMTKKTEHFIYAYAACWVVYLLLLLFPFPAFVITEVNTEFSKNMQDYEEQLIITEHNTFTDYNQYGQWLLNVFWNAGCVLVYQVPITIIVGLVAVWGSFVNSLQAIGEKRIHLISTLVEIGITGIIGCVLITIVAILSTFRPSFERSVPERNWELWDLIFPEKFVDTLVVGLYCLAFVFLYANFIFERLRYWYEKKIYFILRVLCILAAVACFVAVGIYLDLAIKMPELPFFLVSIALFATYNFIIGRFIFFMFFRPELIDDPDFGWYNIYIEGYKPHLERCFYVAPMVLMEVPSEKDMNKGTKKGMDSEEYEIRDSDDEDSDDDYDDEDYEVDSDAVDDSPMTKVPSMGGYDLDDRSGRSAYTNQSRAGYSHKSEGRHARESQQSRRDRRDNHNGGARTGRSQDVRGSERSEGGYRDRQRNQRTRREEYEAKRRAQQSRNRMDEDSRRSGRAQQSRTDRRDPRVNDEDSRRTGRSQHSRGDRRANDRSRAGRGDQSRGNDEDRRRAGRGDQSRGDDEDRRRAGRAQNSRGGRRNENEVRSSARRKKDPSVIDMYEVKRETEKKEEEIIDMFTPEVPDEYFYSERSAQQNEKIESFWKETSPSDSRV